MTKSLQYRFSRLRRKRINEIRQRRKLFYEWQSSNGDKKSMKMKFQPF